VNGQYEPGGSFDWDFSGGSPSTSSSEIPPMISYSDEGSYNVELVVDDGYCTGEDILSIEVPPLPMADIVPQTIFCEGLTVTFENNSSNSTSYFWDFGDGVVGDNSTEESPTYTYSNYGTYLVTLVVDPGSPCSYTDEQQFEILPADPIVDLYVIGEPDICDTVPRLNVLWYGSGATIIHWDFGDGNGSYEESAEYIYEENGVYTVTLTAYNEMCDYEEQFQEEISIGFGPILAPVLIPNVFTPTGDHKNEHFRIYYENEDLVLPAGRTIFDYMSYYHLKIYDRWGVLMYDSDDDSLHMWDGDYNGESSEGVYYYILDYQRKCVDDKILSKDGHLTLLRKTK
jgi:gliding motility-associated-like protein